MKLFLEVFATPRGVKARAGVRAQTQSPRTGANVRQQMQTALGQTARRMSANEIVSAQRATGRTNQNPASRTASAVRTTGRTAPTATRVTPQSGVTRSQQVDAAARSNAPNANLTAEGLRRRQANRSATRNRRGGSASRS